MHSADIALDSGTAAELIEPNYVLLCLVQFQLHA